MLTMISAFWTGLELALRLINGCLSVPDPSLTKRYLLTLVPMPCGTWLKQLFVAPKPGTALKPMRTAGITVMEQQCLTG